MRAIPRKSAALSSGASCTFSTSLAQSKEQRLHVDDVIQLHYQRVDIYCDSVVIGVTVDFRACVQTLAVDVRYSDGIDMVCRTCSFLKYFNGGFRFSCSMAYER